MLIGTNWNLSKIGDLLALRISNHLIKRVHKAKYLGLVIDDKLSWKEHIGYISTKIRRNISNVSKIAFRETLLSFCIEPWWNLILDTVIQRGVTVGHHW